MPAEELVGRVTHYFSHLSVAVVELSGSLKKGERIRIRGHTTDFEQRVESMQIDHRDVEEAKAGQSIGLRVNDKVREHDQVFRLGEGTGQGFSAQDELLR